MKNVISIFVIITCLVMMSCEEGGNSVIGSKDHDIKSAAAKEPEILANGISTTRITVNVKNKKDGANAVGMKVHFKTTAGSIEEHGVTNTNGNAEVVLTSAASETDLTAEITATVVDTNFSPLNKTAESPYKIHLSTPDFDFPQKENKKLTKAEEQQDNRAIIKVKFLGILLQTEIEDFVLPADGISETKVEIRLREKTSLKVIKDAEIRFLLTYGIIAGSSKTDAQGNSHVTLKSAKKAVEDTLVVEYGNKIIQRLPIEYVIPKFELNPKKARIAADGVSKVQMMATLLTHKNTPITGAKIKFSTTAGIILESAFTDNYGQARADLVAGRQPDSSVKVIANFISLSDSAMISFGSIDVKTIALHGDNEPLLRDGRTSKQIGLIAKNTLGLPVADVVINIRTNIGNVPETIVTDQQGNASFKYSSDAGSFDATATITASAGTVQATQTVNLLGITMNVTANPASILADGKSTSSIRVEVKQTTSHLAVSSHSINFAADRGTIATTASTDNQGVATTTYTAGSVSGIATIMVNCGTLIGDVKVALLTNYPKNISLTADSDPILRDGVASKQFSLQATNDLGQPVANVAVNINANLGTVPGSVITDHQGNATFKYTADAGNSDATATITASVGTVQVSQSVKLVGISMTVTANPTSLLANGSATSLIRVEVKQTVSHIAVTNHLINFAANLGSIPTSASTDNQGIATSTYTAGTTPGTATISIACGLLKGEQKITLVANYPKTIELIADANPIIRDGLATKSISVSTLNELGGAVANVTVNLQSNRGTVPATIMTDSQGKATFNYTADAGSSDATATITASAGTVQATKTVNLLGINMVVTANPASILADGKSTSTIRVEVKQTMSHLAVSNHAITFATNSGTIPTTANTDNQGIATTTYTASSAPGIATIYASCGTLIGDVKVALLANFPKNISLSADSEPILRDGVASKQLSLQVTNDFGQPVANVAVNIAANLGTVPGSVITDSQGKATFNYTADSGTSDATATITASVGTVQATQTVNLLGISMIISATPDSILADDKSTATIQVVVKQTTSNIAVTGHLIGFVTDNGKIPNTATTDNQGVATTTFTSSKQPGTATVTASCGTLSQTVKVYLFDNFANSILLTSEYNFIWVKGTGHIQQTIITAKVLGVTGQLVTNEYGVKFRIVNGPGGGERIEPSTGSGLETSVIRTVNGKAEAKFLSGTISGAAQIRAELVDHPQVNAQTTNIIIRSGPPYIWIDPANINNVISHMTLAVEPGKHNVAFGNPIQEIKITAYLGDKYNNPVENETVVYLTTTGGYITTNAITCEKGQVSVILQNVNPFPYLVSQDPSQLTALNIPNPNNDIFNDSLKLPIVLPDFEGGEVINSIGTTKENDGMAVILAYTWGHDQSGNAVKIWATARVIYSVGVAKFTAVTNKSELAIGESATISIRVYDHNGNPVAAGSSLNVSTTAGELSDSNLMPSADKYGFGTTFFSTQLLNNLKPDDEPAQAMVKISLDSPNGTGKISIPINLKVAP